MRKIEGLNSLPRDPPDRLHEALLSALGCPAAYQSPEAIDGHRLFQRLPKFSLPKSRLGRLSHFCRKKGSGRSGKFPSSLFDLARSMHLDESSFTLITTMAAISLAGSPVAAFDNSDGLQGFGEQLRRSCHHSSLHFRDKQRRADRSPADARTRSWSQRCHR